MTTPAKPELPGESDASRVGQFAPTSGFPGFFERTREGIVQTRPGGSVVWANPAAARILGYDSVEEFIREVPDIRRLYVDPSVRARLRRSIRQHGHVVDFEYQMRLRDGRTSWMRSDIHVAPDPPDGILYEGTIENITERKQAEAVVDEAIQRREAHRRNSVAIELATFGGLALLLYGLVALFNWFEGATSWMHADRSHEHLNQIMVTGLFLISGLSVFAFRRWRESVAKVFDQRQVQVAAKLLREELDFRVRQRTAELAQANAALRAEVAERARAAVALRLQGAALTAAANAIVITDRTGTITWGNPAFTRLTGYSIDEAVGKNPRDLVKSGRQGRAVYQEMWETILSGKPWSGRLVNRRKDGSFYHEEQTITPVRGPTGEVTHFIAIKQDLTERLASEEGLELRNALLSAQQEASIDGILVVDEHTRILSYNRRFIELWGIPVELIESRADEPMLRFVSDQVADPAAFIQRVDYLYEHPDQTSQDEIILKDGRVLERYSAPMFGPQERYYGRVWYFHDATARKNAERQIREQNEIITNAREAVVIVNLRNEVTLWNRGAERIFGWTSSEALGRDPEKLFGVADTAVAATLRTAVERDGGWSGEIRAQTRVGRPITVDCRVALVRDDLKQPRARINFLADITEQKQLEEKFLHAQRLESIGMLAAGIAHDMNNVLAPIMFAAPLLRDSLPTSRDLKILETVEKSAARGASLVKQILGFVHSNTGDFAPTQVKHLARDIIAVIEETFPKSIQLEHDVPTDLWPVQGNATQIHQVLLNLCVNARDAMPQGGILRLIAANRRLDAAEAGRIPGGRAGVWLVLEVGDTGTGIPPELLEQIWQPFFTTKGPAKGTGLGLSTVRGIVANHHGFLTLDTEVGRGTTFRAYLPAIAETLRAPGSVAPFDLPVGQDELVLVVDDDAHIRDLVCAILKSGGYRALSCSDGLDALDVFETQRGKIAAVVTDVDMPRLGGVALARALLQLRPEIRLLAMSGHTSNETGGSEAPAIQSLVHAFILKPFSAEDLLRAVHRLLHKSDPP